METTIQKLEFGLSATVREAEVINFILGQGLNALKNKTTRDTHGISAIEAHNVEQIRHQLIDQLINPV